MITAQTGDFKIGICRFSSLGDVALSTVCLDFLERIEVKVNVFWVGMRPHSDLIRSTCLPIQVMDIDPQAKWRSILQLPPRLAHLHLFIDVQNNLRSRALCTILFYRYQIPCFSYDKQTFSRLRLILAARLRGRATNKAINVDHMDKSKHSRKRCGEGSEARSRSEKAAKSIGERSELATFMRMRDTLVRALSMHVAQARPRIDVKAGARVAGQVVVAPGASYATKQAPPQVFARILSKLLLMSEMRITFYFLGTAQEKRIAAEIIATAAIPSAQVKDLTGQLLLPQVLPVIATSMVLLGNDSGLMHIAEAVGTPVAALFGPTVEDFGFRPWRRESRVFSVNIGCRPCSKHGSAPCRYGDKKCFNLLNTEEIANFMQRRLT